MKAFSFLLVFLSFTTVSFSQNNPSRSGQGSMKMEDLPGVVIKSAGKDFSVYIPDRNPDVNVRALEDKFIAYDLGRDYEGFENYLVIMETPKGSLTATYNENGKLMSVVENYKNVKLPTDLIYSIYKTFPGWQIVNDKYLYSQKEGDIIKKEYNLKIKKDNEVRRLVVKPSGEIIKGM
ncbi:hypothetical protein [Flavobacterium caseinilyticum]|uniref:Nicotinate-nucleotide adenylyltransferase n=1 Tax=Flavobacterium caseinilyticum TaxID=2541732 RepID=A0A4R5B000_9FLAO|nr:hypothetical protein [Flavobacterium caseinilyticum]TDD78861.1 hypothetical protein E0F89_04340 [Flavobacterium caseinilyticum]